MGASIEEETIRMDELVKAAIDLRDRNPRLKARAVFPLEPNSNINGTEEVTAIFILVLRHNGQESKQYVFFLQRKGTTEKN
jgi:hypothetical protein